MPLTESHPLKESLIPGCPHWELPFTENGNRVDHESFQRFLTEAPAQTTDVFLMSHGWNNSPGAARDLYRRFFGELGSVVAARGGTTRKIGTAGVIWPSILWPEDDEAGARAGGAAGLGEAGAPVSDADFIESLAAAFPASRTTLEEMARLLRDQPADPDSLKRFHALMVSLDGHGEGAGGPEDLGESAMKQAEPLELFERFDAEMPGAFVGGGAGLGDAFGKLWNGAKQATRMFTYWQMKKRAGVVGERGLGAELVELQKRDPKVRVHLIGHSFGARLVSFALLRVPETNPNVSTLFLAQGAFSHFAFADSLPFDAGRGGALKGMTRRVAGPLCVTHTRFDSAVGKAYPAASFLSREDAAAREDQINRWGAMGSDGAQAVNAKSAVLGPAGTSYAFEPGKFINLDGNDVIRNGSGPSGSHSDIVHPEIAWALAKASGVL